MSNHFGSTSTILHGVENAKKANEKTWNNIIVDKIEKLVKRYKVGGPQEEAVNKVLTSWHKSITIANKHDAKFSPHVSGFYMIFMVHGPWYNSYKAYQKTGGANLSKSLSEDMALPFDNPNSYFNMLATDIDVPDITEEYTSVSSRLRNSFVPSRDYFVSDFSISYIESINLDVMRYHEAWHKYMNLLRRGEVQIETKTHGYFIDMPYSNAVWVAVFKPFTTDIQLLIKLMGVMPVTMPLKQIVGNRTTSKMTVLNISYKAADLQYKFYTNTAELLADTGMLSKSFQQEVIFPPVPQVSTTNTGS